MKRIILTVAALAAIITGGVAAAAPAMASPNPNSTIEVTSQAQFDALKAQGPINKNIDVPASVSQSDNIWLAWATINGNVTVEGYATMSADTVNGNVTVQGPGSYMKLDNYASHITGNLTVQNSSGVYVGGPYNGSFGNFTQYNGPSQIDGGLIFTNNTGGLFCGYPLHVNGTFVYTGPSPAFDRTGLSVDGQQFVSG